MPWSNFKGHSHWKNVCWLPFSDFSLDHGVVYVLGFFANIALFFPFGFCFIRSQRKSAKSKVKRAVLYAAALSLALELFQSFGHGRIASTTDIGTNAAEAAWGAVFAQHYREAPRDEDWRREGKETV